MKALSTTPRASALRERAITFAVISLIAGVLGFTGVAQRSKHFLR